MIGRKSSADEGPAHSPIGRRHWVRRRPLRYDLHLVFVQIYRCLAALIHLHHLTAETDVCAARIVASASFDEDALR